MRRLPSSWDKTLVALGFRRRVNRDKRDRYHRKHQRVESLERREMLSVEPSDVFDDPIVVTPPQPPSNDFDDPIVVTPPELPKDIGPSIPTFFLADSAAGDTPEQFDVTTEYASDGSPTAVVRLKEGLTRVDRSLQELTLELRLGREVLSTHEVLIDLAESKFLYDFNSSRDRLLDADLEPETLEADPVILESWVRSVDSAGRFTDLPEVITPGRSRDRWAQEDRSLGDEISPVTTREGTNVTTTDASRGEERANPRPTTEDTAARRVANTPEEQRRLSLERITAVANGRNARSDVLADAGDQASYYRSVERVLRDLDEHGHSDEKREASTRKLIGQLAISVGKRLAEDLGSPNAAVSQAAQRARDELLAAADPYYTMFAGLRANHELAAETDRLGRKRFSLNIVETGTVAVDGAVRVELGDHEGMVQVRSDFGGERAVARLASQVHPGPERDASVSATNPTVNDNSTLLSVVGEQGPQSAAQPFVESGGQVTFEAENYHYNHAGSADDWTLETNVAGYSGSGFLENGPENGASYNNSWIEAYSPRVDYEVEFSQAGTYYVWLRGYKVDVGEDSAHVGINGSSVSTGRNVWIRSPYNEWTWTSERIAGVGRVMINVPSPGKHTFNLWEREDGARVDKIILTTDVNYTPTGTGPAESPHLPTPTASLLGFDLSSYDGSVVSNATLSLTPTQADGSTVSLSAYQPTAPAASWDESGVTYADYEANLEAGFGATIAQATPSVGSTVDFDVTETIQRALLLGDSNLNGILDPSGAAGDIEAFYLAQTDFAAYQAKYGSLENASVANGLTLRNDANADDLLDSTDAANYFTRHGIARGDFNVDGVVDGKDYSLWSENFGAPAVDRFGMGDGNLDGFVDAADYTLWGDTFGQNSVAPASPDVTFRLLTDQFGDLRFHSSESSTSPPQLTVDIESRVVVQSFDSENGDLRVRYEVQNEAVTGAELTVYQEVDGVRTPLVSGIALSGGVGVHEHVFAPSFAIANPSETYTLVAEVSAPGSNHAWRDFEGGVFETADRKIHAHGTAADDTITYEHGGVTVANAGGQIASYTSGALDFRDFTFSSVVGQTAAVGGYTPFHEVRDDGRTFYVENNSQQGFALPATYTVTANTIVEFDYESTVEGEWHGFALDTDLQASGERMFRLHGYQAWNPPWPNADPVDYVVGSGTRHYKVRVGDVFTGAASHIYFSVDNDGVGNGNATFSNFRIYEEEVATPATPDALDFGDYTFWSVHNQTFSVGGHTPFHEVRDNGQSFYLENNSWQGFELATPYTVTADTVVEFDYQSTIEGESHGFGLDTNLIASGDRMFRLHGYQPWSYANADPVDYVVGSGARHYKIHVGDTFTGLASHLYFSVDSDAVGDGNATFSNFRIYEEVAQAASNVQTPPEVYAQAHDGADTIEIANYTGAELALEGGAGDDLFELAGDVAKSSIVRLNDRLGLDEIKFDSLSTASMVNLVDKSVQAVTPNGSSESLYLYVDNDSVNATSGIPVAQVQGPGYDREIIVDNLLDETDGDTSAGKRSLREALELVRAIDVSGSLDVTFSEDLFDGSPKEIRLEVVTDGTNTPKPLLVNDSFTVTGPGADQLTISGQSAISMAQATNVFTNNPTGVAVIRGVTITGASSYGVSQSGTLTLDEVEVRDNEGGGVYGDLGGLTITNSTIADNGGHGIYAGSIGKAITNTTISGNAGTGVVVPYFTAELKNVTVFDNDTGISVWNAEVPGNARLVNTIVAGSSSGIDLETSGSGLFAGTIDAMSNHSIVQNDNGLLPVGLGNLDLNGGDPLLTRLGYHGGPTRTHALLVDSNAIDSGSNAGATGIAVDQRGFGRIDEQGTVDIGAYEANDRSADVVFVIDASQSMDPVFDWIKGDVAERLDLSLEAAGVDGSRYGLLTFNGGPEQNVPNSPLGRDIRPKKSGDDLLYSTEEFSALAGALPSPGGGGPEDGYYAIDYVLDNYVFRAKAPVNIILASDEPRGYLAANDLTGDSDGSNDAQALIEALDGANAVLNVVVDEQFTGDAAQWTPSGSEVVVGVPDTTGRYLVAGPDASFIERTDVIAPAGGDFDAYFTPNDSSTNNSNPPDIDTTFVDYVQLAWATGGATWDLNALAANGGVYIPAFTAAFAAVKAQEIAEQQGVLAEADRFVTERRLAVPPTGDVVRITFTDLTFDSGSGNPADVNDALEIALLDPEGNPALVVSQGQVKLGAIGGGADALFNLTQGQSAASGVGVEWVETSSVGGVISGYVNIDVRQLPARESYDVVVRLLNNDADQKTQVELAENPVSTHAAPATPYQGAMVTAAAQATPRNQLGAVAFARLLDVSNSFDVGFERTSLDEVSRDGERDVLRTRLSLTKRPGQQVRNELLLAVKPPTPQDSTNGNADAVRLDDYDGRLPYAVGGLPAGTPYVRVTRLLDSQNGFYKDDAAISGVELAFEHEGNARFDFELVVLGELNDAPEFTSNPYAERRGHAFPVTYNVPMLEIAAVAGRGNTLEYTPATRDPNGDHVSLEVVDGPDGVIAKDLDGDGRNESIEWTPDAVTDPTVYTITLRARDEHGLASPGNDQTVLVRVVDGLFNRPPAFQTPPETLATFGEDYRYESLAVDPEGHNLAYAVAATPVKPVAYEAVSVTDLAGVSVGQVITHLTFNNDQNGSDGVSMFSNVRLHELTSAVQPSGLEFDSSRFTDLAGLATDAAQVTGDTSVLRLTEDATVLYKLPTPYTVTADTVLSFTFSSEQEGVGHGIGVEDDPAPTTLANDKWFRVYGPGPGGTELPSAYDPVWSIDQSSNFSIDPATGVATWKDIPTEAVGQWVHVEIAATETNSADALANPPSPLGAVQSYELLVRPNPANRPPVIVTPELPGIIIPEVPSDLVPNEFAIYRKHGVNDESEIEAALLGSGGGITPATGIDHFVVKSQYDTNRDDAPHPSDPDPNVKVDRSVVSSIGVFYNDTANPTYGLPKQGVVLSTGDVGYYGYDVENNAAAHSVDYLSFGFDPGASASTRVGDLDLASSPSSPVNPTVEDQLLYGMLEAVTKTSEDRNGHTIGLYTDITSVAFTFDVAEPSTADLYFDVVVGSEEWDPARGAFVGTEFVDAFGIFLNPELDASTGLVNPESNVAAPAGYVPGDYFDAEQLVTYEHPSADTWKMPLSSDADYNNGVDRNVGDLIGTPSNPISIPLTADHPQVVALDDSPGPDVAGIGVSPNLDGVLWPFDMNSGAPVVVGGSESSPPGSISSPAFAPSPVIRYKVPLSQARNTIHFVLADSGPPGDWSGAEQFDMTVFISSLSVVSRDPYSQDVLAHDPDGDDLTFTITDDPAFEAGFDTAERPTFAEGAVAVKTGREDLRIDWDPPAEGSYYVKVIASDEQLTDEKIYQIEVEEDYISPAGFSLNIVELGGVPETAPQPEFTVQLGREIEIQSVLEDADLDRDEYTYHLADPTNTTNPIVPADWGLWVDEAGTIRGTPGGPLTAGSTEADLELVVTDTGGNSDAYVFDLKVEPLDESSNTAPMVVSAAPTSIVVGEEYRYVARATDDEYDPLTWTLAYGPDGMSVAEDGRVFWATEGVAIGRYAVGLKVSDGYDRSLEEFFIEVLPVNAAPVIERIPDKVANSGVAFSVPFIAYDADGGDELEFGIDMPTVATESMTPPEIVEADGSYKFQWANPIAGIYPVRITVTDGRETAGEFFYLTVYDSTAGNSPPVVHEDVAELRPVVLGEQWTWGVYFADAQDGDSRNPSNSNFVVDIDPTAKANGFAYTQSTGVLRWTPGSEDPGNVTITATDSAGASLSVPLILPVNVRQAAAGQDEPARITSDLQQTSAMRGRPFVYRITAEDLDVNDDIELTVASFVDANGNDVFSSLPASVTGTGSVALTLSGTVDSNVEGPLTLVVEAFQPTTTVGESITYEIPVRENAQPALTIRPGDASVLVNTSTPTTFPFEVVDFDGDSVLFELLTPVPEGDWAFRLPDSTLVSGPLDLNAGTEQVVNLHYTATAAGGGPVTVRVSDGFTEPVLHTFNVEAFASAPTLAGSLEAAGTAGVGTPYIAQATRTDNGPSDVVFGFAVDSNDPPTIVTEITANGDPTRPVGMRIDAKTGRIDWTPNTATAVGGAPYSYTVVMHEAGNVASRLVFEPVSLTVVETFRNTPPRITSSPAGLPFSLTQPFDYGLTGEDDEGHPLTWKHVSGPGRLDGDRIVWEPTIEDLNTTQTIVVRVNDPYGPGESQSIELSLTGSNLGDGVVGGSSSASNTPPRITSTPTVPGGAGETYTYTVTGEDVDGHALSLFLVEPSSLPSNAAFTPNGDGTAAFTWTPATVSEELAVSFGIRDEQGLRGANQSFTLRTDGITGGGLVDTPIRIDGVTTKVAAVGSAYDATILWTDPDVVVGDATTAVRFQIDSVELVADGSQGDQDALVAALMGDQIIWTPSTPGLYRVTVSAEQGGATATYSYGLQAIDSAGDSRPTIDPGQSLSATPGQAFTHQVTGSDDGPFEFYLVDEQDQLVREHNGFSITASGLVSWTVPDNQSDAVVFTVDALDSAQQRAVSSEDFTVTIVPDEAPTVSLFATPVRQEPGAEVLLTIYAEDDLGVDDIRLTVTDPNNVTTPLQVLGDNTVRFTIPDDANLIGDSFTFDVTVLDKKLQNASDSATVTVRGVNAARPVVEITSTRGVVIEEDFKLMGRVYDDDNNLVYYSITATPTAGGAPIVLVEESINNSGDSLNQLSGFGQPPVELDTLSPFSLPNGSYFITVYARDDGGLEASDTALYEIRSDQKLGNFGLSFTDLTVPVAGFPLSVVRSYDSTRHDQPGDFGLGWSLELITGRMSYLSAGDADPFSDFVHGSEPMYLGSVVNLTIPGGEEHAFTVQAVAPDQGGAFSSGLVQQFALAFQPEPGQASRLDFVPRDNTNGQLPLSRYYYQDRDYEFLLTEEQRLEGFLGALGRLNQNNAFVAAGGDMPINPSTLNANLRLTTRTGEQYIFDATTNELALAIDRDGNFVEFQPQRYTAYTADRVQMGELTIVRDGDGRITQIGDEAGARIVYKYKDGLLTHFWDRTVSGNDPEVQPDPVTATARFYYGEDGDTPGELDHFNHLVAGVDLPETLLTSIRNATADPNDTAKRTLTLGWDADFRLQKLGDASSANAEFEYDTDQLAGVPDNMTVERVFDATDAATELLRDSRGNVVRRLQRLDGNDTRTNFNDDVWLITHYAYDADDRQVAESKPFTFTTGPDGVASARFDFIPPTADLTVDPDDNAFTPEFWQSVLVFGSDGNLVREVGPDGLSTTYSEFNEEYGFAGIVRGPDGSITATSSRSYSIDGRVQKTTAVNAYSDDPNSVTELYFVGPILQAIAQGPGRSGMQPVSGLFYDRQIRLASTTDAAGLTTVFGYDKNDNQNLSYYVWIDPNGGDNYAVATVTEYDSEDRVTGTKQYQVNLGSAEAATFTTVDELNALVTTPLWSTSTHYNDAGLVYQTVDRFGTPTFTLYDSRGNVVETRTKTKLPNDADAWVITRTAYDENGRVVAVADPFVVTNTRTPEQVDFNPASDSAAHPATGLNTWSDYRVTHTLYDDLGRVVETRRVAGVPVTATRSVQAIEAKNHLYNSAFGADYAAAAILSDTVTVYDDQGRVQATKANASDTDRRDDLLTFFGYDAFGRQQYVGQVFDANGDNTIDAVTTGDTINFAAPDAEAFVTQTVYDTYTGQQLKTIDARGIHTEYVYDSLGRVNATIADAANTDSSKRVLTSTRYDHAGRRVASVDPLFQTTTYGYDPATGRLTSVSLPPVTDGPGDSVTGQATYTYAYDVYGNQTQITDPRQNVTQMAFDHLHRQVSRTLPEGTRTPLDGNDFVERSFYSDVAISDLPNVNVPTVALGQMAFSVDFEGRITQYLYDNSPTGGGRLVEERYYNAAALTVDETTTLAQLSALMNHDDIIEYEYDAHGRQVSSTLTTSVSSNPVVHDTVTKHDANGRVSQIATPEGVIDYDYDDLDRLTGTSTNNSNIEYEYDALGRLTKVTINERGGAPITPEVTQYEYDQVGNLARTLGPDDVISNYVYDNLNRLDLLRHFVDDGDGVFDGGDTLLAEYDYTLRKDGRRSGVVETDDNGVQVAIDWVYDELGRLTEERRDEDNDGMPDTGDYIHRFGYDLGSNRVRLEVDNGNANPAAFTADETTTYQVDANDRLLNESTTDNSTSQVTSTTTYEYGAGNSETKQTKKTVDGDTYQYEYDNQGRMSKVTVTIGGGTPEVTTYRYDTNGVRVSQKTGSDETEYLIDPLNHTGYAKAIEEFLNGTLARSYVFGHAVLSQTNYGSSATHQFLADGHGSTRVLYDGVTATSYAYTAFGDAINFTENTALTNWLFGGDGVYDPASGLTQHLDRWRDGHLFTSVDVYAGNNLDPISLHKYLYVHGDPVNGVDPSGLASLSESLAVLSVRTAIFAINRPLLTGAIGFAVNTIVPADVHNAMVGSGIPPFQFAGASGRAARNVVRTIAAFKAPAFTRFAQKYAASPLGRLSQLSGELFEQQIGRFLPGASTQVRTGIGKHTIDFVWRGWAIDAKSGKSITSEQLAAHAAYAASEGLNLAYYFLQRPPQATINKIQRAGGSVVYLFD